MKISNKPHEITDVCWWYEHPKSIEIIYEVRDGERYIRTDHVVIQYRTLLAAMKRAKYPRGVDDE